MNRKCELLATVWLGRERGELFDGLTRSKAYYGAAAFSEGDR